MTAQSTNLNKWFAELRLEPYLRLAARRDALAAADVNAVQHLLSRIGELAGPAEPPARLHGDLWPGNVLWAADGLPGSSPSPRARKVASSSWSSSAPVG